MRFYFDSDKAWKFLCDNGYVFTLRVATKEGPPIVSEVEVWRKRKRTQFVGNKVPIWQFSTSSGSFSFAPGGFGQAGAHRVFERSEDRGDNGGLVAEVLGRDMDDSPAGAPKDVVPEGVLCLAELMVVAVYLKSDQ